MPGAGGVGVGCGVCVGFGVGVGPPVNVGVMVEVGVGVGVGAHSCPAILIASAALTIEADAILPAKLAITVPVLITELRSSVIFSNPLHLAWARSATPEIWGAAIDVPLMYT